MNKTKIAAIITAVVAILGVVQQLLSSLCEPDVSPAPEGPDAGAEYGSPDAGAQ